MDEGIKDAKDRLRRAAQNEATCIELSRQNTELRARLAEVEEVRDKAIGLAERINNRLAEVETQRDGLKAALEKIADSRRYGKCSRLLGEIMTCAREALAKLEEK